MIKQSQPLVSIVTPSFNSADYIEQAIVSVQRQDYSRPEHIIIDGQSTDGTLDILRRYEPAVTWLSEPDNGQADAINKGFRMAKGEIVGWLNADDTYQLGAIKSAVAFLLANPAIDLVYGNFNFVDEHGQVIATHTTPAFTLEKILYAAIIPQTSMFFRRRVLDGLGGVNPDLHYTMDWEFTLRVVRRYNVARVAQTWGNFRIVEGTKSAQQPEKFWPEIIPVLQQTIREEALTLNTWADDALFMAHLLAGLEFARVGQTDTAQIYVSRAFEIAPQPVHHPAVLASGLYRAAVYPWHNATRPHPLAQQALDNFSQCLTDTPKKQEILECLSLYRALKLFRQGRWQQAHAGIFVNKKTLFNLRTAKMMASALLKP